MSILNRRQTLIGFGALGLTAGCMGNTASGSEIDARVDATMNYLLENYPSTRRIVDNASGYLVMPLITEAGFGVGGSYGRGALQIDRVSVAYYEAVSGSLGLQIGAKQFAHVLFFMTPEALARFRNSDGLAAGADFEYVVREEGANLSVETTQISTPVLAMIFGQAGLHVGASLDGTIYNRLNV